jgi:hypothetical protein
VIAKCQTRNKSWRAHRESKREKANRRQQRDVAAGDRNHVIRAGRLQLAHDIVIQTRAVTDEDRDHDTGGPRVSRRDETGDGIAGELPGARPRF